MTSPFNELFTYEDGRLYWAVDRQKIKIGQLAGGKTRQGYRRVRVDGRKVLEHRIIYEMHNGPIPEGLQIDHINGVRDDNRIENLRVVTRSENSHNQRSAKGFCFHKPTGKFMAYIYIDYKQIHLGYHETEEEARSAYLKGKAKYHPTSPIVNP